MGDLKKSRKHVEDERGSEVIGGCNNRRNPKNRKDQKNKRDPVSF